MEFEWDPDKEQSNVKKHQVDFAEAKTVFNDPLEVTIPDPTHSLGENRFPSLGRSETDRLRSETDRLVVVSYTERHGDRIRIINARLASRKERRQYERRD